MPGPTASSLGKFGDIPVSYYTGVPSVNIPIYTVTDGPISLPVSLSYHASGLKVGELASWAGFGFSVQAGLPRHTASPMITWTGSPLQDILITPQQAVSILWITMESL
ncbi:hypothetical protein [Dyadobacter tibetensis]|uniref:hypothetical protein n=1 Tax=Dyadobacter tibetensis TaxID=1211851 RepID=UPI00103A9D2E|nr:hypothetical protein [Dyadobacter tibetensis]